MFEGFALEMVELPEATLRVRHGGFRSPSFCCMTMRLNNPRGRNC
jgi:hypothetical protein